ncbi:MAG: hypothetical protein MUC42_16870 [Bryobacter sp.]|jgi:CRISPR type III-A-associated RAMP protein Csm4|nr:hypothetical protein [Bryobacter sp.]
MNPALLVRLRPVTPWRIGTDSGAREQASPVYPSDTLFGALCSAFQQLGWLEEWLDSTVRAISTPAVRSSSAFPFHRHLLYAPPPAGLWPPSTDGRLRWKGASFLPTSVIAGLLSGEMPSEQDWTIDPQSACLVPVKSRGAAGPFRFLHRSNAAVDRMTGGIVAPYSVECVQFAPEAGLWCAFEFSSHTAYAVWAPKLQAGLRLLSDSGFGGLRSRGFGRARNPLFQPGNLASLLWGERNPIAGTPSAWWTLSLFSPGASDAIQWDRGAYHLTTRSGRSAGGRLKLSTRLVQEGSVLVSPSAPVGTAIDVAPEGSPQPLYRAAFSVALPIAWTGAKPGVA